MTYVLHSASMHVRSPVRVAGLVALPGLEQLLGDPSHGVKVVLGGSQLLHVLEIVRDIVLLEVVLERLPVLIPVVDHRLLRSLHGRGDVDNVGRRPRCLLSAAGPVVRGILAFPLTTLGRLGGSSGLSGGRRSAHVQRGPVVVVYTSHVVLEVPLARKPVSRMGAVTALVGAQVGLVSMAVHGVSLTLVSEKACGRREAGVLARVHLASVGLQVGVDKFATSGDWSDSMHISNIYRGREDLTHSCTSASRACGCNWTGPPMGSGKVHRLGEMHSGKEGGPGQKIHHRRWCDAQRKGARQMHPH